MAWLVLFVAGLLEVVWSLGLKYTQGFTDLGRAKVEPFAWVVNRSLAASGTKDPLLSAKLAGERRQLERIASGLASKVFLLPWLPNPPVGVAALTALSA